MHVHVILIILLLCLLSTKVLPSRFPRVHPVYNPTSKQSESADTSNSKASFAALRPGYTPRGIQYYGGRVLTDGVNVYLVWYGNWNQQKANSASKTIIRKFISQLGETPTRSGNTVGGWWNINSLYYNKTAFINSKKIKIAGELIDNYSRRKKLKLYDDVTAVAFNLVKTRKIPNDPRSLILVLTSPDVTEGNSTYGFCTAFCGYHTVYSSGSYLFQYGVVGNAATQCPGVCIANAAVASPPNGDIGADGMISVIAHELTETATDPNLNAWYNYKDGYENADICAWDFGTVRRNYNLIANDGSKYLVQKNWNPYRGNCTLTV